MNYAFKMMAVLLALGVLVLQGCRSNTPKYKAFYADSLQNRAVGESGTSAIKNYFARNKTYSSRPYNQLYKKTVSTPIVEHSISSLSDYLVCYRMVPVAGNSSKYETYEEDQLRIKPYIEEARRRGLDCGINNNINLVKIKKFKYHNGNSKISDEEICLYAYNKLKNKWIDTLDRYEYVRAAKSRGLSCNEETIKVQAYKNNLYKGLFNNVDICDKATTSDLKWETHQDLLEFVNEAKRRGLGCGVSDIKGILNVLITDPREHFKKGMEFVTTNPLNSKVVGESFKLELELLAKKRHQEFASSVTDVANLLELGDFSKVDKFLLKQLYNWYQEDLSEISELNTPAIKRNISKIPSILANQENNTKSVISSSELKAERTKRKELERKLVALQSKQKQEQQRIDSDTRVPLLEIISNKTDGKRGTITGIAKDNVEVAEVTVDGKPVSLSNNGDFQYSTFVPSDGIILNVQVTDVAGLTSSKTVSLQRNDSFASTAISFDRLNPLGKRVKTNSNALALIVGVEGYENTNADALYADRDAKMFRDYASEKLGIPENRIKTLLNDNAEYAEILLTTKDWLRRASKSNKSDIYIFFAGHGLASDDGKNMYLLPYDGRPRLLDKTALLRDELFKEIQQANPRSVTVFLDTCYSGTTRGTDMLIASRPIAIRALEQSIPNNFTVFSAAAGDQTSKPLEEAKHGMFSYFLMKGMEGDADTNNDNKITARELHAYVEQNVVQQSSGSQTPELQGDKDRVLVQFN